ncbi:histidine phosphatase family protein [Photobacterium carnosum]|uniref:histidine phosphatase family protein n=1 Tax=Photobacterium carnosum TaxID=2023717 RepID=UPI001E449FC5|nr:histidine phosphatase family protein [Photobacterium carnosum]MCD9522997.1 histidine phosphatase family protein [Photobacterium carnosum]
MTIYLCRHGQTLWNFEGRLQGQFDSQLTALGLQQAQQMVPSLTSLALDQIICSDLGRCVRTAHMINQSLALPLSHNSLLRERCFGALQGVLPNIQPLLWQQYHMRHQQNELAIAGAESAFDVQWRVQQFITQLFAHPQQNILIVSHGEWIRSFLNWQQGLVAWSGDVALPQHCQLIKADHIACSVT